MKTKTEASQKSKTGKRKLPKDVTISPDLDGKYDDQPPVPGQGK